MNIQKSISEISFDLIRNIQKITLKQIGEIEAINEDKNISHPSRLFSLLTLIIIDENPNCTMQKISSIMNRDKSQITRTIKDLSRLLLITISEDSIDKRKRKIQITEKGIRSISYIKDLFKDLEKEILKDISDEDIQKFRNISKRIINNIHSYEMSK